MRALLLSLPLLTALAAVHPAAAQTPREAGRLALTAASQNRWAEAEANIDRADPLIRKALLWMRLTARNAPATAPEILAFAESAPDWPGQDALARNMEALLETSPDDALAIRWFATRPPRGLSGALRYADALANAGRAREAQEAARRGWAETPGDAVNEPAFLERHGARLTPETHAARFDRLAYARDFSAAARVLPYLDANRQAVAQLRLSYAQGGDPNANAALAARDAGATLERARALRSRGQDVEAANAFAAGAASQQNLTPEAARAIWNERQLLARRALRLNDDRTAYQLVAQHGQPGPGEPRQEAEFLAGFIALQRLNQPREAAAHFARVAEGSQAAITQARSGYWRGLALLRAGQQAEARAAFSQAANYPVTFYGQLASVALGETPARLNERVRAVHPPSPTAQQTNSFNGRELSRLVLQLAEMGEGRRARPFLLALVESATQPWERTAAIQLAARTGRPENPVWVARRAGVAGAMLLPEGWPSPFPVQNLSVEPALVQGITRQESNFDPEAISGANARGLMQLLPTTAAQVARRINTPHQLPWLQARPEHNLRLGSAYIGQMIDRFGGHWPFAIAAYNAGPARVDEWLQTYGDPRGNGPSMLEWLELIPFNETRNYVQRVLENVVVYRALAGQAMPHPMAQYLR